MNSPVPTPDAFAPAIAALEGLARFLAALAIRHVGTLGMLLREELRRLNVQVFDRVAVSALLTEGGQPGARVVGAMGVHCRSGASVVVRAKATAPRD